MMDTESDIWRRLQEYQKELADLCDQVTGEMSHNRQIREKWHDRTLVWKKRWWPEKLKLQEKRTSGASDTIHLTGKQ